MIEHNVFVIIGHQLSVHQQNFQMTSTPLPVGENSPTSQECSFGVPLSKMIKDFIFMLNSGCMVIEWKYFLKSC